MSVTNSILPDVVEGFSGRTAEGKYQCRLCEYVARDKYNMRSHLDRKHSLASRYTCEVCKSVHKTQQALSQHRVACVQLFPC